MPHARYHSGGGGEQGFNQTQAQWLSDVLNCCIYSGAEVSVLASSDPSSTSVHRALSGLHQLASWFSGFWLGLANGKHQQKSGGWRWVRAVGLLLCQGHGFLCLRPQLLLRALSYSYSYTYGSLLASENALSPGKGREGGREGKKDGKTGRGELKVLIRAI